MAEAPGKPPELTAEVIEPALDPRRGWLQLAKAEAAGLTKPFEEYSDMQVAGKHTFIDASEKAEVRKVFAFFREHEVPQTSACILVPDWPNARFNHYLKGSQLLKQYASGTLQKYPVNLIYVPARQVQLSAVSSNALTMSFQGTAAGYPVMIGADSQASHIFISQDVVDRARAHMTPMRDMTVELADGMSHADVIGICSFKLHMGPLHETVRAYVMKKLASHHDVILGDDWLTAHKTVLDYERTAMTVKKGDRKMTITSYRFPQVPLTEPGPALVMSAAQAKRALKKHGDNAFIVMVRDPTVDAKVEEGSDPGKPVQPSASTPESIPTDDDKHIGHGVCDRAAIKALLHKYRHLSQAELPGLPPDRPAFRAEPIIRLVPGARPPAPRMYRLSPREKQEVEAQITRMLRQGIIQPSTSPFGAPILFVPKPNGTLRLVVDWRALNNITIKDAMPLPRIDDLIDKLQGSTVWSSTDYTQGYYQVRLHPDDVPKTAFKTHIGLYEYKVVPLGLSNSPTVFQRVMNQVFAPYLGKFVLVYLDDILVYSRSAEEHLQHLETVLKVMDEHKFYINMTKCQFNASEVKFLGHIINKDGVKPDPAKVKVVFEWPVPENLHELRSFLGLVNYFRKFIDKYARVCMPLTELLKKGVEFHMNSPARLKAFERLKELLVSAPCLRIADTAKPFEVIVDASQYDIAGILLQEGHPVAFESRKLNQAECNYPTHEREMLAAIHCLKVWRCYLDGCVELKLFTDHKPLLLVDTQPHLSARQVRWMQFLSRFGFEWHYKQGKDNPADFLTRQRVASSVHGGIVLSALTLAVTTRRQARAAAASDAPPVIDAMPVDSAESSQGGEEPQPPVVQQQPLPEVEPSVLLREIKEAVSADPWFSVQKHTEHMTRHNGVWMLKEKLVIPHSESLRQRLIAEHHDPLYSGHFGAKKTAESLSRFYWWPQLRADVRRYVQFCDSCQRNKSSTVKPAGLLRSLPIPEGKWQSVGMDFITQLPCTKAGYDSILVVTDRLSKLVHLIPTTTNVTAAEVAQLFVDHVVKHHGVPESIVSDRDSKFTSIFWKTVCELWGIRQAMSTSFHPQTDGQTERVNRVLEEYLRHYVSPVHDDWDRFLASAEFALNDSYHASIGMTPFYMTYGYHPRLPGRVGVAKRNNPEGHAFVENIHAAVKKAKELLRVAQEKQKQYADSKRRELEFAVGSQVLLSTQNIRIKSPGTQKLLPRYIGPFPVLERIGEVAYKLELPSQLRVHPVFHVSLLKPYISKGQPGHYQPPPLAFDDEGEPWFEVEAVLEHRDVSRGRRVAREYLIKWKSYDHAHNTWEPERNLNDLALNSYWQSRPRE